MRRIKLKEKMIFLISHFIHYNIKVMDKDTSLKLVREKNLSVIRFGDGEFDIMRGKSIPYQKYSSVLARSMNSIILNGSTKEILVCLPDVFCKMNRYSKECKTFYYRKFFYQNRKILKNIVNTRNIYGSTFISRPYIDLEDKTGSAKYFHNLKKIWNNRDILIVEGKYTRSGEGNDLFNNAKSIKRIICPSKNSYEKINAIEKAIKDNAENRLILLMLGPTAKIIIFNLKKDKKVDNQLIDIGHIDTEYEWFKRGVVTRVQIPHKHTAEYNNSDNDISIVKDEKYLNEIVEVIN